MSALTLTGKYRNMKAVHLLANNFELHGMLVYKEQNPITD